MSRVNLKGLAKHLGLSVNGVRAAMADGRISAFKKTPKGYEFDLEMAVQEYEVNTNQNLSSNPLFEEEADSAPELDEKTGLPRKSVLDKEPKFWSVNEALQAKTIYAALKVKHELDVQEGKYYLKVDADREFSRMATAFGRGLLGLHVKVKGKIPDLTMEQVEIIRQLAADLVSECEAKL